jgi:hypothetical protein
MLLVVQFHAAVPSRVGSIVLVLPCPQARPRRQNYAAICKAPEADLGYLLLLQVENGIKIFAPEGRASGLMRGNQARRLVLPLIFFSNGSNDIINCQEGVHHFRVKVLA